MSLVPLVPEHEQGEVLLRRLRKRRTALEAEAVAVRHAGGIPAPGDLDVVDGEIGEVERALAPSRAAHRAAVNAHLREPCRAAAERALAFIAAAEQAVADLNGLRAELRRAGAWAPDLDAKGVLLRLALPLRRIAERNSK